MAPNKPKIQKMSLADMEKYQNSNGMVSMEFIVDYTPYKKGERAGFPPIDARGLYNGGIARVANGALVQAPQSGPVPVQPQASPEVEIPEGWENFSEVKLVLLAKKFDPEFKVRENTAPRDHAAAVIRGVIDARRQNEAPPAVE